MQKRQYMQPREQTDGREHRAKNWCRRSFGHLVLRDEGWVWVRLEAMVMDDGWLDRKWMLPRTFKRIYCGIYRNLSGIEQKGGGELI